MNGPAVMLVQAPVGWRANSPAASSWSACSSASRSTACPRPPSQASTGERIRERIDHDPLSLRRDLNARPARPSDRHCRLVSISICKPKCL
jgi:hypothetical protein